MRKPAARAAGFFVPVRLAARYCNPIAVRPSQVLRAVVRLGSDALRLAPSGRRQIDSAADGLESQRSAGLGSHGRDRKIAALNQQQNGFRLSPE